MRQIILVVLLLAILGIGLILINNRSEDPVVDQPEGTGIAATNQGSASDQPLSEDDPAFDEPEVGRTQDNPRPIPAPQRTPADPLAGTPGGGPPNIPISQIPPPPNFIPEPPPGGFPAPPKLPENLQNPPVGDPSAPGASPAGFDPGAVPPAPGNLPAPPPAPPGLP